VRIVSIRHCADIPWPRRARPSRFLRRHSHIDDRLWPDPLRRSYWCKNPHLVKAEWTVIELLNSNKARGAIDFDSCDRIGYGVV